jgi:hypothetical protein
MNSLKKFLKENDNNKMLTLLKKTYETRFDLNYYKEEYYLKLLFFFEMP